MVRNEGRGKSKSMCMRTWDNKVYWQTLVGWGCLVVVSCYVEVATPGWRMGVF